MNDEQVTLPWDKLYKAPSEPGLYAWYLRPTIRPADLHDPSACRSALEQLAARMAMPDLRVDANSHLAMKYRGTLTHDHLGSGGEATLTELIDRVAADSDKLELLSSVLAASTPALASPLYIGVAKNLHKRLQEHKNSLVDLKRASVEPDAGHTFAIAASQRQLPLRRLIVTCVPLGGARLELIREVAEAAESLLNRIFHPILGRR